MIKTKIPLLLALGLMASCGDLSQNVVNNIFRDVVEKNMEAPVSEFKQLDNYTVIDNVCEYVGEDPISYGWHPSVGLFKKSDGKYCVPNVFWYKDPNAADGFRYNSGLKFFEFNPLTGKLEEDPKTSIEIDSSYFLFDNPFFRMPLRISVEASGISVDFGKYSGRQRLFYSWNGESFVLDNADTDGSLFAQLNPASIDMEKMDDSYFSRKTNPDGSVSVSEAGNEAFRIRYAKGDQPRSISVFSDRYNFYGYGIGNSINDFDFEPDRKYYVDDCLIAEVDDTDAGVTTIFAGDESGIVRNIKINYRTDNGELFRYRNDKPMPAMDKMWQLLVAENVFNTDFINAEVEVDAPNYIRCLMDVENPNSLQSNDLVVVATAAFQIEHGDYMLYYTATKITDAVSNDNGEYTYKKRLAMGAYIYDGNSLVATDFDIPVPDLKDVDLNKECDWDPVPMIFFDDEHAQVWFFNTAEEFGTMPQDFRWTGNIWEPEDGVNP